MSFKKAEVNNYLLYDTPIENVFISEFAKNAPGEYVKLYLLACMYMEIGKPVTEDFLAKALGTSVKEINDGWDYWRKQGVVNLVKRDGHTEIEFVSIKDKIITKGSAAETPSRNASKLRSEELANLVKNVEKISGRLLEAKETEAILGWVNSVGVNAEVVLEAYSMCVKKNLSTSYRYVEKILLDWQSRGLDSIEKLKEYLADTDRHYSFYRRVFNSLGFKRNPTKPEMDMMDTWLDDLNCTADDLDKAIKKTTGITNPNLNYINTILVSDKNTKEEEEKEKANISIDSLYERLRQENEKKTNARRAYVYGKVGGLEKVCKELLDINKKITMSFISKKITADELNELKEKQQSLQKQKEELLGAAGFTLEDLNPIYTCSKCEDTGILEDGRRCSCFVDRMSEIER